MASGATRANIVKWHVIDARDMVVGRLASRIATLLQGKHKPVYSPHMDIGDNVIVVNCTELEFTGRKYEKKLYRWHTGYPGGLKSMTPKYLAEVKDRPEDILKKAVSGMLPKNKLRRQRLQRLKIFRGEDHPHWDQVTDQVKEEFENRKPREVPPPRNAEAWPLGPVVDIQVGPEEQTWAQAEHAKQAETADPFPMLPEGEMGQLTDDTADSLPWLSLDEAEAMGADMFFLVKRLPNAYWDMFPDFKAKHPEWFGPDGKKREDL